MTKQHTIKSLKTLVKKYKNLSYHDSLTGLYNHRKLEKDLKKLCYEKLRYKIKFVVVMIDIDKFKKVNDKWGHKAGDKLLIYISKTMKKMVRQNDEVYRRSGDEFIIILKHTIIKTAKKIVTRIKKELVCEISYGITTGKEYNKIMETVDKKMYKNKRR